MLATASVSIHNNTLRERERERAPRNTYGKQNEIKLCGGLFY